MSTESLELPVLSVEKVKGEFNLELTRQKMALESLSKKGAALVFAEDQESLDSIKGVLADLKKVESAIDKVHETGKAPYLEGGRVWDKAKREYLELISEIKNPIQTKYNELAQSIDRKAREKAAKEAHDKAIRQGVESNILEYSKRIAVATTTEELLRIESSISAQKAPQAKSKYGDLHDEAIAMFDEKLLPILRDQKTKIKEAEELDLKIKAAEKVDDVDKIDELRAKETEVLGSIQENQVRAQETALNHEFKAPVYASYTSVSPSVKARRTTVGFELVDVDAAIKKGRNMLSIEINREEAKKVADTLKDSGAFKDKDEITVNGVRFFIQKSY